MRVQTGNLEVELSVAEAIELGLFSSAGVQLKSAAKPAAKSAAKTTAKRRGRPPGSKNKTAIVASEGGAKRRGRPLGSKNKPSGSKPSGKKPTRQEMINAAPPVAENADETAAENTIPVSLETVKAADGDFISATYQ